MINKLREKPSSETQIENTLNVGGIDWSCVYVLGRQITIDSYLRQFHFKLTHNILYFNKMLKTMKLINTSLCYFSNDAEETPIHLFYECQTIVSLWCSIQRYFITNLIIPDLTPPSAILGFYDIDENKIIINQILLTFKMV